MSLFNSAEDIKKKYESVPQNVLRLDLTSDGQVEASLNAKKRGWTFTAYLTALLFGPSKSKAAGIRIEKNL